MSFGISISLIPRLLPVEKVLYVRKWIWAASGKSQPSYRLFFSLPPVQEAGLYLTDKRMLVVYYFLRILAIETSIWFPRHAESKTEEVIQTATVGKMPIFGRYIEIISKDPIRHWYRSPQSRLRIFLRDPKPLYDLISKVMSEDES